MTLPRQTNIALMLVTTGERPLGLDVACSEIRVCAAEAEALPQRNVAVKFEPICPDFGDVLIQKEQAAEHGRNLVRSITSCEETA